MDIGLSLLLHPAGMGCWAELIPRAKEQGQRERGYRHSNAFLASAHSALSPEPTWRLCPKDVTQENRM